MGKRTVLEWVSRGQQGGGQIGAFLALLLLLVILGYGVKYWPITIVAVLALTVAIVRLVRRSHKRQREEKHAREVAASLAEETRRVEEGTRRVEAARIAARMPEPRAITSWQDAEFDARDVLAGLGFVGVVVTNPTPMGTPGVTPSQPTTVSRNRKWLNVVDGRITRMRPRHRWLSAETGIDQLTAQLADPPIALANLGDGHLLRTAQHRRVPVA